MKKLIPLCFLLLACKAQLREPFCKSSLTTTPKELQGLYEMTAVTSSPEMSGNFVLRTGYIMITNQTIQSSGSLDGMGSMTGFCQVQNKYYLEQMNLNGTYSLTEINKGDQGLVMAQQSVDVEKAVAKKFKILYLPMVDQPQVDGSAYHSGLSNGDFILDNTNLTADEVLTVIKPVSMQIILKTVPQQMRGFKPAHTYRWNFK